jgi:hypothetical protein
MVQLLSMRTKLIMAMLALVGSVALMGVTADEAHAGVTEMRSIYNYTGKTVYAWNHESGKLVIINPGGNSFFNQWIPWCTGSTDFYRGKYIEIGYIENGVKVHKYSIWQQNKGGQDRIRYTKLRGYDPSAQAMPGASTVDGRRDLVLWNLDAVATSTSTGVKLYYGQ